jgi:hypothetical protein
VGGSRVQLWQQKSAYDLIAEVQTNPNRGLSPRIQTQNKQLCMDQISSALILDATYVRGKRLQLMPHVKFSQTTWESKQKALT